MPDARWRSNGDGTFSRWLEGAGSDTTIARETVQDVEPILARNKRIRNDRNGRTVGGGRLLGSVPNVVIQQWIKEWTAKGLIGPGNMDALNSLIANRLRDGDWQKLRTVDKI